VSTNEFYYGLGLQNIEKLEEELKAKSTPG
jgi:hypothetical protein